MLFYDAIKLSTRMFRTRPVRTWLTIFGMGVGFSAVVILVGLGYGLQGILLEKIVFGEAMLSLNVIMPPSKIVLIDKATIEEFKKMENVEDVAPLASFNSTISYGNLTGSITLQGVEPPYFKYAGVAAKEGDFFKSGEKDQIVLSSAVLKLFSIEPEDIIGKTVNFKVNVPIAGSEDTQEVPLMRDYKVKGVIEDETSIYAYISLGEFSSQFVIPYYEKARVKVTSNEFLTPTEEKILGKGFMVTALSKTVDQANKVFSGIQVMLAVFGGIALVVSAIGMFNTMTVTLLERTKEIGIMRTIGGAPFDITYLFLSESIMMGFLGGLVGIMIGVGSGWTLNFILNFVSSKMGGTPMALFRFPISFLVFIAVFSFAMGFLTGLFPAKRAGSLNPLDAIRYN